MQYGVLVGAVRVVVDSVMTRAVSYTGLLTQLALITNHNDLLCLVLYSCAAR